MGLMRWFQMEIFSPSKGGRKPQGENHQALAVKGERHGNGIVAMNRLCGIKWGCSHGDPWQQQWQWCHHWMGCGSIWRWQGQPYIFIMHCSFHCHCHPLCMNTCNDFVAIVVTQCEPALRTLTYRCAVRITLSQRVRRSCTYRLFVPCLKSQKSPQI